MTSPIDDVNDTLDNLDSFENQGVTPMLESQLDEQEIDNLLVEEGINEDHYPTISDIANPNAIDDVNDIT